MTTCIHLEEEVKINKWVISKHLDRYKYFRGIKNKEEATRKFIDEYSFLIRDLYCQFICKEDFCVHKEYERNKEEQYLFPDDVDADKDINKDHNYFEGKEDHIGL